MSHEGDVWTRWGRYTNEAAIEAASNHDEIILSASRRTMFAVHPIPDRYLDSLDQEERRMLRQHLDYLLRNGAQDDFERATSETLTNLNTLGNTGRPRSVHFNSQVECDDGSCYRAIAPEDQPGDDFFNDPAPPNFSSERRPRGGAPLKHSVYPVTDHYNVDRSRKHRDQPSRQPASGYGTPAGAAQNYYNASLSPDQHRGYVPGLSPFSGGQPYYGPEESFHNDHGLDYQLPLTLRPARSQSCSYGPMRLEEHTVRADFPYRNDQYAIPQRKSVLIRNTNDQVNYTREDDRRPIYTNNPPSSSGYSGPEYYPARLSHPDSCNLYHSSPEHVPQNWELDNSEAFSLLQDRSRIPQPESPGRRPARQMMDEDEQLAQGSHQRADEDLARDLQEKLSVDDRHDEYAFAQGYGMRPDDRKYDEPLESRSREDRHCSDDRHRSDERHRHHSRHRSSLSHHHRRHRSHSRRRSSGPPIAPFASSLIPSILRNGTRSEFFEALYTLHPEEAPDVYRIHVSRNAERTSRHKLAIKELLKSGSVRDIEKVFGEENVGRVFEELGRVVEDRRDFW
jgi:hypothetical protein